LSDKLQRFGTNICVCAVGMGGNTPDESRPSALTLDGKGKCKDKCKGKATAKAKAKSGIHSTALLTKCREQLRSG
jgi:hypothetical protein